MEDIRFRNHFFYVIEEMYRRCLSLLLLLVLFFTQLKKGGGKAVFFIILVLALLILFAVLDIGQWRKTLITIDATSVTIDKHTLFNKKKITIGIRNISNINLEQSVAETLFGVKKVKFDTNTLSLADATDVTLVLKAAQAEELKAGLMERYDELNGAASGERSAGAEAAAGSVQVETSGSAQADIKSVPGDPGAGGQRAAAAVQISAAGARRDAQPVVTSETSLSDICIHGLLSINLSSMGVILVAVGTAILMIGDSLSNATAKSLADILVSVFLVFIITMFGLSDVIKNFIRYYGLGAVRSRGHIYLKYGLFKRVSYTVPVDKIGAVQIVQNPLARICRRYSVQIINVGMGDEGDSQESTIILYCSRGTLREKMEKLLPEYVYLCDAKPARQPAAVWFLYGIRLILAAAASAVLYLAVQAFRPKYGLIILVTLALVFAAYAGCQVLAYLTQGTDFLQGEVILSKGIGKKTLSGVRYDNIQYVKLKENPVAAKARMVHGVLYLLASVGNIAQDLSYVPADQAEKLLTKIQPRKYRQAADQTKRAAHV